MLSSSSRWLIAMDRAKNYITEKVTNMKKPEASVTDVDLKSLHRNHIEYVAKVSVENPYPTPIPICQITYVLKSDSRMIAHGTIPDPGSLKAGGKTDLEVPVKVPHTILVSLVRDKGRDWDIDYELELGLVIDIPVVGNFTIPLSSRGEVKLHTLSYVFSSGGGSNNNNNNK